MRESLPKRDFFTIVFIQNTSSHLADLHLKISLQKQREDKKL